MQRTEAYRYYVTDSLFFLQHINTSEDDADHGSIFAMKYRDIINHVDKEEEKDDDPDSIVDRMIQKSQELTRGNTDDNSI